jgi:uncharacterized DUF497 family protein
MRFEWDEAKRRANLKRHGFDFQRVEEVFANETSFTIEDDRFNYVEIRFLTLGVLDGRVVAIAHTETDEVTRVISLRKASKHEEEIFYKEIAD